MAEEVLVEEQESDVLKEINDSYLKSKKKKSIIIFSIISAIVIALSAVIIAFSAMKITTKPTTFAEPTKFTVTTSTDTITIDSAHGKYDEFYKLYEDAFKTSYLTAIFTESLGGYNIVETTDEFYGSYSTTTKVGSGKSSTLTNDLGSDYIHLYYMEQQTLHDSNGNVYYSNRNSDDYELSYYDVYFSLSSENKLSELTFYIGTYGYSTPRITTITVKANTYALYQFVNSL